MYTHILKAPGSMSWNGSRPLEQLARGRRLREKYRERVKGQKRETERDVQRGGERMRESERGSESRAVGLKGETRVW